MLGFRHGYLVLFEEKRYVNLICKFVAQLKTRARAVDGLEFLDRAADVDVIYLRLLLQFGQFSSFGGADHDFELRIPEFGDHHKEEEQDKDDIRQGSG